MILRPRSGHHPATRYARSGFMRCSGVAADGLPVEFPPNRENGRNNNRRASSAEDSLHRQNTKRPSISITAAQCRPPILFELVPDRLHARSINPDYVVIASDRIVTVSTSFRRTISWAASTYQQTQPWAAEPGTQPGHRDSAAARA